ncbi:MAG: galactose-phosphate uridylyltransferase [Actinomycetia bacterium]|nr:galactose-phosphate uridylyltransferase [Actinomycetes bacterium]
MSELREDPLTGSLVILAPARARRPDTHRDRSGPCPFCPGNEELTPPEVTRTGAGAPNTPGWRVRAVPNLYPIVGDGFDGAHEVVVLSPSHENSFGRLSDDRAVEVFTVLRDRCAFHLAAGFVHAQPFVNSGRAAGASIEHPHAQVVALPLVPPAVSRALERFAAAGRDLVATASNDALDGTHGVLRGDALAWCPPASRSPYEVLIAHLASGPRFDRAPDDEIATVARATRHVLAAVAGVLDDPPYNVVVHTAPAGTDDGFHWYVRIVPRVSVVAGFEEGTGMFVNTMPPELAATALREALPDAPR